MHKRHYLNIFIKKKHFLFLKEGSTFFPSSFHSSDSSDSVIQHAILTRSASSFSVFRGIRSLPPFGIQMAKYKDREWKEKGGYAG